MTAYRALDQFFSDQERARGAAYQREGRVKLLKRGVDHASAIVMGSQPYRVAIEREGRKWEFECTCPAFEEWGVCKHIWATVLEARLASSTKATSTAARAPRPSSVHARRDGAGAAEAMLRLLEADAARVRERPPAPPPNAWSPVLSRLDQAEAEPAARSAAPLVRYVLRAHREGGIREPVVETHVLSDRPRDRGAYRPQGFAYLPLVELAEEDRLIALLLLGAGTDDPWMSDGRSPSWVVPDDAQATIYPALAATGRFFLRAEAGDRHLALDPGPPFEVVVTIKRNAAADGAGDGRALSAVLAREGERLSLADCELLLGGGIVIARDRVSRVRWQGAWPWIEALGEAGAFPVPDATLERVLRSLARLPDEVAIEADEHLVEVAATPLPVLRVAPRAGSRGSVATQLLFQYGSERVGRAGPTSTRVRDGKLHRVCRDVEGERRLADAYLASGGLFDARPRDGWDGLIPIPVFAQVARTLLAAGWTLEAEGKPIAHDGVPKLSVQSGIDWFDLEARVDFGPARAELPELLEAIARMDGFVRLSDGSVGLLPESWLRSVAAGLSMGEAGPTAVRIPRQQAWLLDAWLAEQEDVGLDATFVRLRDALRRGVSPQPRAEPRGFRGELRPYQREGLGWLHFLSETGFGGCLADDMGLGKTVQVLALVLERRARAAGPALVVAPRSVLFNWMREAERFAPELSSSLHHGAGRARTAAPLEDADLVITSYGTLRQDVELLRAVRFDCAVLDEAQMIKNERSASAKSACLLQADLRLALTGTPVENHLGDLRSIFTFLNPTLVRGHPRVRELFAGTGSEDSARLLSRALRPFLLRRTKEQVLRDLPPKTEQVLVCEQEGRELREYQDLARHVRAELLAQVDQAGLEESRMHVLAALLRLRQAACHPGLLDPDRSGDGSAKLETLLPMLDELRERGHKALVFSQFTSFLAILRARLEAQGVACEYLDGQTRGREQRVERFQADPKIPLFLISLKAGGFGLNLTAADYVFLLDPWWNPAAERQAIDRTHRIGQTRPVSAYRLIARGTIEEKVLALQQRKRALADALFEGTSTSLRDLTRSDLEWLLE